MQPIKVKSYEEIVKLFQALTQARILMPKDVNTIFNLLNQIYTVMYPFIEKKDKKFKNLYLKVSKEKEKVSKGIKSYFTVTSNEWERELRAFALEHIKEEEITLGGM